MEKKAMKVDLVSKETINPSSPTPEHLRTFKLSFIDQLAPSMHVQILFFYPNNKNNNSDEVFGHRLKRLKTSLSHTLTHFYPLAGRLKKDNAVVECNDEGVEFREAHVKQGSLSEILEQPDADSMHQFVPATTDNDVTSEDEFLLKVQVNLFEDCGGLAIGVSVSHKIAEASTIDSFMREWSSNARLGCMHHQPMPPNSNNTSLYPSMEIPHAVLPAVDFKRPNCITRRYVFDSTKIAKLKVKGESKMVEQPSEVEAVLALLWKCATIASRTNLGIRSRPSIASQIVYLRKIMKADETSNNNYSVVGNLVSHFKAEALLNEEDEEDHMELQGLVYQLRKGLEEYFSKEGNNANSDPMMVMSEVLKDMELMFKEGIDMYTCISWRGFWFYEADFGWGKPKWVSIPSLKLNNMFVLMDTSDDNGIEAWVTLSEQDMALLETNHELLQFASFNPSII